MNNIKKTTLGLYRCDKKPVGKTKKVKYYEASDGTLYTEAQYNKMKSDHKKLKVVSKLVTTAFNLQPLWEIREEQEMEYPYRKWVYARYAKAVPLYTWETYPYYKGKIFDKK